MKRLTFLLPVIITGCLIIQGCNKIEIPGVPYPRVETLPVKNISEAGVTLNALIKTQGDEEINLCGFEWSLKNKSTVRTVSLPYNKSSEFSYMIELGLYTDSLYFVRAFVTTNTYKVYGDYVSFLSMGSNPPALKSVIPDKGTWYDTVLIRGSHFSPVKTENVVYFGSMPSTIISNTDSTIICIVPGRLFGASAAINVYVLGIKTTDNLSFNLVYPLITGISPQQGAYGDIITITGSNFSETLSENNVYFNDTKAEVLTASPAVLTVRVPLYLSQTYNNIKVVVNMHSSNTDFIFRVVTP